MVLLLSVRSTGRIQKRHPKGPNAAVRLTPNSKKGRASARNSAGTYSRPVSIRLAYCMACVSSRRRWAGAMSKTRKPLLVSSIRKMCCGLRSASIQQGGGSIPRPSRYLRSSASRYSARSTASSRCCISICMAARSESTRSRALARSVRSSCSVAASWSGDPIRFWSSSSSELITARAAASVSASPSLRAARARTSCACSGVSPVLSATSFTTCWAIRSAFPRSFSRASSRAAACSACSAAWAARRSDSACARSDSASARSRASISAACS